MLAILQYINNILLRLTTLESDALMIANLENPPTEDEANKAATSEWSFDHNADVDAHVSGASSGQMLIASAATMAAWGNSPDINSGTIAGVTIDGDLTWSSAQSGVTLTAPTLNGTVTLGSTPIFDVGSGSLRVNTTGEGEGLDLYATNDDNNGVRLSTYHIAANPAVDDLLFEHYVHGKSTNGTEKEAATFRYLVEAVGATTLAGKMAILLRTGSAWNEALTLSSAGALWIDSAITVGGKAANARSFNQIGTGFISDGSGNTAIGLYISGAIQGHSGDSSYVVGTHLESTISINGNTGVVAQLYLTEPVLVEISGNATIATTLYVASAPSEGTTNAAIYVASGDTNLSTLTMRGTLAMGANSITLDASETVDGIDVSAHAADVDAHHQRDRIQDADGQSYVEVGATTDQTDFKNANVITGKISAAGILTWPKQSSFRVAHSLDQPLLSGTWIRVNLNAESWDNQNEFDSTTLTGTDDRANGEGADHLIDNGNAQFTSADVGKYVWNTTDDTYAIVTAYNDAGDLTLNAARFTNGENYRLYHSRFTATEDGKYLFATAVVVEAAVDGALIGLQLYKNGSSVSDSYIRPGAAGDVGIFLSAMVSLVATDYIELFAYQAGGSTKTISGLARHTNLSGVKVG